jgi:predicted dehydrogenase
MRRRAGIAVAGLGRIGQLHASNVFQHVPAAELERVTDVDGQRAQHVGDALSVRWGTDYEELLVDEAVEGIVIATPTALHTQMTERAVRAGKHVLVEKPLGFSSVLARDAVAAARAASVHLQVGFQRRFDPDWTEAHAQFGRGAIGEARLLRISHRNMAPPCNVALDTLGDILIDVAIHDLDTVRWILGDPMQVTAVAALDPVGKAPRAEACESVVLTAQLANGALAVIDTTRAANYGYECSAELLGSRGALRIGTAHRMFNLERLVAGEARIALPRDHMSRHRLAYIAELEHFAQVVLGKCRPEPTGEDAVAAVALVESARASLKQGGPSPTVPTPSPRAEA